MTTPIIIRASYDLMWNQIALHILLSDRSAMVTQMQFESYPEGAIMQPSCVLRDQEAQILMNDLWNAGFRPVDHKYTDLSFQTQKQHLEDMRAIVANKLNVRLP